MSYHKRIRRLYPLIKGNVVPADTVLHVRAVIVSLVDCIARTGYTAVVDGMLAVYRLDDAFNIDLLYDVIVELTKVIRNADQLLGILLGIAHHVGKISVYACQNCGLKLRVGIEYVTFQSQQVNEHSVITANHEVGIEIHYRPIFTVG